MTIVNKKNIIRNYDKNRVDLISTVIKSKNYDKCMFLI